MKTPARFSNQYDINSSGNDELQSSIQMQKFEDEITRTENQIIHLEMVFKNHLSIIINRLVENRKKEFE